MLKREKFGRHEGEIHVEDVPITKVAESVGTPTYVYSANRVRENYQRLAEALSVFDDFQIFYAIKACNNPHIARILVELGCGIDAASPNEIMLAKQLGVPSEKIIFTGNNLYDEDIEFAIDAGVHFNVDDHGILDKIFSLGQPESICFRVNVGSENSAGILDFSGPQSKFGIMPDHISDCVGKAKKKGVKKISLHMMPGSCQLDIGYFRENAKRLAELAGEVASEHGIDLEFLDLGGGLGIPYADDEDALDVHGMCNEVKAVLTREFKRIGRKVPKIVMEPARYIVGDAGILIGRVNAIKNATQVIVGTDLSMNVMARGVLYDASHKFEINRKDTDDKVDAGFCGQVCENTDFHRKNERFPSTVEVEDLMVLFDVGAYGYSMAYDYNGRVTPAEVLVEGTSFSLIRRRKTYGDTLHLVEGADFLLDQSELAAKHSSVRGILS